MKDGIIKGNGNSRYLKSVADFLTQYPTYEAFAAALTAGTLPVDLNGINEDGWQQIGDFLGKASLLQDMACDLMGISRLSVPNDAFVKLALGPGKYGYRITVKTPSGTLLPGITVVGVDAINGDACVTDENGVAVGVSASQTVTLSVDSGFYDLETASQEVVSTGTLTDVVITLQAKTPEATFDTSVSDLEFSPDVTEIDFCAVGAGGGGVGKGQGPGGGGGYVKNLLNHVVSHDKKYSIEIGAEGEGNFVETANDGGTTKILLGGEEILSAPGGKGGYSNYGTTKGGTGNGNGGDSTSVNGTAGSGYKFGDPSLGIAGGGGGGAGQKNSQASGYYGQGGAPYGGRGGQGDFAGENGKGPGGGGGGGGRSTGGGGQYGGDGGRGIVYVRWR